MPSKKVTLVAPDGREYVSTNPAEVTRLRSAGYTLKADKPAAKPAQS